MQTIDPIWATFRDDSLEREFRQSCLREDVRQMLFVGVFVLSCMPVFIAGDLQIAPQMQGIRWPLLLLDRVLLFLCLCAAGLLLARSRDGNGVNRIALAVCTAIAISTLHIDSTRPFDYLTHIGVDVIVLLGIYLIVPIPLKFQLFPAFLFTVGLLVIHFGMKTPAHALSGPAVITCLLSANVIGLMGSRRLAISRRTQYANWREENALRIKLTEALANVRILSGLLPICASCKKIRDDQNYWHSIEAFLSERSELDFTHSICPDCEKRLYPDLQDDSDDCAVSTTGNS